MSGEPTSGCPECGSQGQPCQELFERLLVLDYAQKPPWGPLHGVAVACFFLQHPTGPNTPVRGAEVQWAIVNSYLRGSQSAVDDFTKWARQRNSHRNVTPAYTARPQDPAFPAGPRPRWYGTTIADVAVDGSFPAAGYPDRVRDWARSIVTAWSGFS